jgi:DNA-binding CsgD family transcriptional regulator
MRARVSPDNGEVVSAPQINIARKPALEITPDRAVTGLTVVSLATVSVGAPDFEEIQTCLPIGLIVVDETGLILWRNNRARDVLVAGCGIEERQGKIRLERASLDRTLHESLQAKAVDGQDNTPRLPLAIGVPDRDGRMHYVLQLVQMRAKQESASTLVAIVDLVRGGAVNRMTAAMVFNLSRREAELAELFSEGLCIEEIAPRMGVAPNTARIHLRNVFAKTGCCNQIELARILARAATLASVVHR